MQGRVMFAIQAFVSAILLLVFFAPAALAAFEHPVALDVRAAGDDQASRITIDFDQPVQAVPQLLEHPWRLVLDFDRVGFGFDPKPENWTGMVNDLRWGDMSDVNSRIIFELDQPFKIIAVKNVKNEQSQTHRVIVDIVATDAEAFKAELLDRMRTSAVVNRGNKSDRLGVARESNQTKTSFHVVLDPGHGGIDGGARGRGHVPEKELTLAFALQLKAELETIPNFSVVLTRTEDVFVPLNDRVQFARQQGADLFISIHADSLRHKHVRGATVYTISEEASDSVAAEIAEGENGADAIAGLHFEDEPADVSDILIDLARRETLGFSVQFARLVVGSIKEEIRMIKNPHRHAGFRVLRAPDIPSVLIELGFMSNPEDEKLLNQPQWRAKTAIKVKDAIEKFAALSGREVAKNRESQ